MKLSTKTAILSLFLAAFSSSCYSQNSKNNSNRINGHEYVDLGLSVKWATCNVGAKTPTEYGGYYAWGESQTKNHYDFNNCFDCLNPQNSSSNSSWGIYKNGGKKWILPDSGHDTATENWGKGWRMPMDYEWDELYRKCKWLWTTINGKKGYKVIGPNNKSIFLPAAGWKQFDQSYSVGSQGHYWSNTLVYPLPGNSKCLGFGNYGYSVNNEYRSNGCSVRPVVNEEY